ncbi:MAG: phosphonate ABC transporter, permease protein PhnE [Trichodesmium sp. MAG_R03]|nr:phosphonate ABC transporter, permease protein PhnE [Trichodesmium sp. MAG_R03]
MFNSSLKLLDLPPAPRNWIPLWISLAIFFIGAMIWHLGLSFGSVIMGIDNICEYLSRYLNPDFTDGPRYLMLMVQTLAIALWGTVLAFIASFLLAPLGANNLSPHPVIYQLTRELFNFLRAMPDLMLALIFVIALGLGPTSGILALGVHTAGFLGKFFAESMERVTVDIYEGVRSTGANLSQVVMFAAVPSILPEMVGYTLYIFDRNVRMASVLGLVGAGGIGLELHDNLRLFRYNQSAALILIILGSLVMIDYLSSWIRRRIS